MKRYIDCFVSYRMKLHLKEKMQEFEIVETIHRKIDGFTYVLVNKNDCTSKIANEGDMIEMSKFTHTHVIAFVRTQTKYNVYWNENYEFLEIFDKTGKPCTLDFDSVKITSLIIYSDFKACHYDKNIIVGFKFKLLNNPFEEYIDKHFSVVEKSFEDLCPKGFGCEKLFPSNEFEFEICTNRPFFKYYIINENFNEFLQDMKSFGENFDKKFYEPLNGINKFNRMIRDNTKA